MANDSPADVIIEDEIWAPIQPAQVLSRKPARKFLTPVNLAIAIVIGTFALSYGGVFSAVFGVLGIIGSLAWSLFFLATGFWILLYPISTAIIIYSLTQWLNSFNQADKIKVVEHGVAVGWPVIGFTTLVRWEEITSTFLFCPNHTMLPEKWLVVFGTTGIRPVKLRMPLFEGQTELLLERLKEHSKQASIDPSLIELWEPAIADSHTELWLKSLEKAPGEEKLLPLFPGTRLKDDRYLIINRIGVGGQGTAYLARDTAADLEVVVKETLFPVYVDSRIRDEAEGKFRGEMKLLERLNHPRVVKLIESFIGDHRGYAVLEHVSGSNLRQLVKKDGPLSAERTRHLLVQMCEILEYLHGLTPPVVHRDFTPENLMLDDSGNLKLIDFNVAREVESTRTATIVGKQAYLPPEQFRGEPTCQSDIYALGATIYFLLTGHDPVPISQSYLKDFLSDADVDADLDAVVSKATALELSERFASIQELAAQVRPAGTSEKDESL